MFRPDENRLVADEGPSQQLVLVVALVAVSLTVFGLDQLTKWIAWSVLDPERNLTVIPSLLDFQLRTNPNGAFGLFAGVSQAIRKPLMLGLALLAITAITFYTLRFIGLSRIVSVSLGLILGGAIANQTDRIVRGEVIDFISLHWAGSLRWPTFNLADVAISLGSIMLAIVMFRIQRSKRISQTFETP